MRSRSDLVGSHRLLVRLALLAILVSSIPATAGLAQDPGQGLRQRLEQRFEILPLEDGIALVPHESLYGVRTIELRGERVAVNGAPVTRAVLTSWLQEAAPPVLELAGLDPSRRAALFGFDLPAEGSVTVESSPESPPASVNEEVEGSPPLVVERAGAPEAPEPPAPPERPSRHRGSRSGERVIFGHPLTIEVGEVVENAIVFGGPLDVNGEVLDGAVSLGGDIHIRGRVLGDVAAMGGSVYLEDGCEVQGDVVSVGGRVHRSPGARVFGEVSEAGFGWKGMNVDLGDWFDPDSWSNGPRFHWPFWGFSDLAGGLLRLLFFAGLVALALFLARGQVERVEGAIKAEPWKAGLTGLGGCCLWFVLMPFVALILIITIIGIPVVGLVLLASFVAALVGYAAVAHLLGSALSKRFGWVIGPVVVALIGLLMIRGWSLLGGVFHLGGWVLFIPALALGIFGILVNFSAWMVGFGGVLLAALQGRQGQQGRPLPPIPIMPPPGGAPPPPVDLPGEEELERVFEESLEPESTEPESTEPESTEAGDDEPPVTEDDADSDSDGDARKS